MSQNIIKSNKTLLELAQDMYLEYGRYINKWRAFPLYDDGLKLVERRVLYSEYLNCKDKLTKSAEVVGYCMGKFHPHGNCLREDTIIPLLNGSNPTIKELCEKYKNKKFWVYSCDPKTLEIVPGLAHSPRVGQITDEMYRITLDNGQVVECTGNHPFMTRCLSRPRYIKACDLKVGESLRSLNLHKDNLGYLYVSVNGKDKTIHSIVGDYIYGKREGYIYHHKNNNILNNDPDNLCQLIRRDHILLHQKNEDFKNKSICCLNKGRIEMFSENGKYRQKTKQKNINLITRYNNTHIYALDRAKIYINNYLSKKVDNVNLDNYNKYRKEGGYNVPKYETLIKNGYIKNFDELYQLSEVNHKVVKIEIIKLDKPIAFYDITVDKYENFAIGQGIFVHNSSIYGTLVQLVNCGLSKYNGNFECDIGLRVEPPAADRYTEVQMSPQVVKMAFQHLKFVPFESLELPQEEPLYLPTKLPFCLLRGKNYCVGIGFAYRTIIPSYTPTDLVKRLKWLLSDKTEAEPIIKPVTDCILENNDDVYKQLLTTGKAKLFYKAKVVYDKKDKKITIYSKCPTKKWTSLLRKFKNEIEIQKSLGYIDESSGTQTKITFQPLKRGQDLDKIYKKIQDCISGFVSFQCNMCDRVGNVALVPVDQMLLRSYMVYKKANKDMLEYNITKCQQIIDELTLVEKVKKVLPKWLKEFPDDIEKIINGVQNDTSIDIDILKDMFEKYTIPKFARCKTDTSELKNKIDGFRNCLNNLNQYVWRFYEQL